MKFLDDQWQAILHSDCNKNVTKEAQYDLMYDINSIPILVSSSLMVFEPYLCQRNEINPLIVEYK